MDQLVLRFRWTIVMQPTQISDLSLRYRVQISHDQKPEKVKCQFLFKSSQIVHWFRVGSIMQGSIMLRGALMVSQ